jgi:hypothetical protein
MSQSELQDRLSDRQLKPITLHFGQPEAFSGHGILLSCAGGQRDFQSGGRNIRRTSGVWSDHDYRAD